MKDGFLKTAALAARIKTADCAHNAEQITGSIKSAAALGAKLIVLPELCLTGAACGDLFYQSSLIAGAEAALAGIITQTAQLDAVVVLGTPVKKGSSLYNCGCVLYKGEILALVPSLAPAPQFAVCEAAEEIVWAGQKTVLDAYAVITCKSLPSFRLGVSVGGLFAPLSPNSTLLAGGATIIAALSAQPETGGRASQRRGLLAAQTGQHLFACALATAGDGESTTDFAFSGHCLIAQNGRITAETKPFGGETAITEIDLEQAVASRRGFNSFASRKLNEIIFDMPLAATELSLHIPKNPFIPEDEAQRREICERSLDIMAAGLITRMRHTGCKNIVLGLSGGLDSTLALIAAARAYDKMQLDREGIHAVTMPCFGTSGRTKSNALKLAKAFGVTLGEIDISAAVTAHLSDIGHPPDEHDTTYENAQARERTQVLMDLAGMLSGFVIGTGDLSELALGWTTYNGDHMSMYGLNASVPKTLVRELVRFEAERAPALKELLGDIIDTPVSPELLPPVSGEIAQQTEDIIGPYELHDFFLYYFIRFGFGPAKLFRLAKHTFKEDFGEYEIKKWLILFIKRFFQNQFKRSCMPDGPQVTEISLSPRAGFAMPSDAAAALWLSEAEAL